MLLAKSWDGHAPQLPRNSPPGVQFTKLPLAIKSWISSTTRCIIEGPIDVHPRESAVIVHYDVEAMVVSEYGEPMVSDQKKCTKV